MFSEVPPHPWHTVGSDLFYLERIDFLVIVDYFSKYLIIRKIPNSTSSAVIKELGMIFSEFGKPLVFRSDQLTLLLESRIQILHAELADQA